MPHQSQDILGYESLNFYYFQTGSVYQASLSYGSNRIINKMREVTQNNFQEMKSLNSDLSTDDRNPLVLVAYKVSKIEISDVIEPEPLP